jgi:DNA-binding transcriptional regulator GbsR (MarR family)
LKGFFSIFFAILVPKNFLIGKNKIYKNFSVFSARPKNFSASGNFFFIFLSLVDEIMHKRIPIKQKTVSNILMRIANQTLNKKRDNSSLTPSYDSQGKKSVN